jgi:trk system potassium uptake protein TrkH
MGAISTGGFSPRGANVAYYDLAYCDWVLTVFIFISGANFTLHFRALKGRSLKYFWSDPEFSFYLVSVAALSLLASAALYMSGTYHLFSDALRYGAFQVTSFVTTAGFVGANYDEWPYFVRSILFICLFAGGCAGSTSGGIKQGRVLIVARHAARQIKRTLSPRSVLPLSMGGAAVKTEVVSSCLCFFCLYLLVLAGGVFLVTLYEPDLLTAISGVASTLGNVGPGFGGLGPGGHFAAQAEGAKWIYSFLMLCGRLELYTVLILFSRAYWRDGIIIGAE